MVVHPLIEVVPAAAPPPRTCDSAPHLIAIAHPPQRNYPVKAGSHPGPTWRPAGPWDRGRRGGLALTLGARSPNLGRREPAADPGDGDPHHAQERGPLKQSFSSLCWGRYALHAAGTGAFFMTDGRGPAVGQEPASFPPRALGPPLIINLNLLPGLLNFILPGVNRGWCGN